MKIFLVALAIVAVAAITVFVILGCIYWFGKREPDDVSSAVGEAFDSFFWLQSCLKVREDYPKTRKLMNTILDTLLDIESIVQGEDEDSGTE